MLHMLQQADLARLMFPIGEYAKPEVRAMAAERGLASADRPESQDICFVPGGDYRNLLREERADSLRPGPIVDLAGRELGRHQGLPLYTIGQRRGLGIAAEQPLYVTALDAARNARGRRPAARRWIAARWTPRRSRLSARNGPARRSTARPRFARTPRRSMPVSRRVLPARSMSNSPARSALSRPARPSSSTMAISCWAAGASVRSRQ